MAEIVIKLDDIERISKHVEAGLLPLISGIKDQISVLSTLVQTNAANTRDTYKDLYELLRKQTDTINDMGRAVRIEIEQRAEKLRLEFDAKIEKLSVENGIQQSDIDSLKTTALIVEKLSNNSWMKWGLIITSIIGIGGVLLSVIK